MQPQNPLREAMLAKRAQAGVPLAQVGPEALQAAGAAAQGIPETQAPFPTVPVAQALFPNDPARQAVVENPIGAVGEKFFGQGSPVREAARSAGKGLANNQVVDWLINSPNSPVNPSNLGLKDGSHAADVLKTAIAATPEALAADLPQAMVGDPKMVALAAASMAVPPAAALAPYVHALPTAYFAAEGAKGLAPGIFGTNAEERAQPSPLEAMKPEVWAGLSPDQKLETMRGALASAYMMLAPLSHARKGVLKAEEAGNARSNLPSRGPGPSLEEPPPQSALDQIGKDFSRNLALDEAQRRVVARAEAAIKSGDGDAALNALSDVLALPIEKPLDLQPQRPNAPEQTSARPARPTYTPEQIAQARAIVDSVEEHQRRVDRGDFYTPPPEPQPIPVDTLLGAQALGDVLGRTEARDVRADRLREFAGKAATREEGPALLDQVLSEGQRETPRDRRSDPATAARMDELMAQRERLGPSEFARQHPNETSELIDLLHGRASTATREARTHYSGIPNKRAWDEDLAAGKHSQFIGTDIKGFKWFNDTLGQTAGDQAITQAAQAVHAVAERSGGSAYAIGGDEFAIGLPATANRKAVEREVVSELGNGVLEVTGQDGKTHRFKGIPVKILGGKDADVISRLKTKGRSTAESWRTLEDGGAKPEGAVPDAAAEPAGVGSGDQGGRADAGGVAREPVVAPGRAVPEPRPVAPAPAAVPGKVVEFPAPRAASPARVREDAVATLRAGRPLSDEHVAALAGGETVSREKAIDLAVEAGLRGPVARGITSGLDPAPGASRAFAARDVLEAIQDRRLKAAPQKFSRAEGGAGLADDVVRKVADSWNRRMPEGLRLEVVGRQAELPEHLRALVPEGQVVDGVRDPETGKIYVVSENLKNLPHLAETIIHESVGHDGLRGLMGPKYDGFLDMVWKSSEREIRESPWLRDYPEIDLATENGRRAATDEWAAREAARYLRDEATRTVEGAVARPAWLNRFVDHVSALVNRVRAGLGLGASPRAEVERMIREGRWDEGGLRKAAEAARDWKAGVGRGEAPLAIPPERAHIEDARRLPPPERPGEEVPASDAPGAADTAEAGEAPGVTFSSPAGKVVLPPPQDAPSFGFRHKDDWLQKAKDAMLAAGKKPLEVRRFLNGADAQMRLMEAIQQKLDPDMELFPESAGKAGTMGPLRKNSDPLYVYTFDLTTSCLRRIDAAATMKELTRALQRPLNEAESLAVVLAYRADGKLAPCLYCYVESPRRKQGKMLLGLKEALDGARPAPEGYEKVVQALRDKGVTGDWVRHEKFLYPEGYDPSGEKTLTFTADFPIRKGGKVVGYKERTADFQQWITEQANGAKAKKIEPYEEYTGQVWDIPQEKVDYLNARAGLRLFSNSDLQPQHIADLMQMLTDSAARGLRAHAYSKEPLLAKIFGKTGLKIQTSLFAKTMPDGRIVEDASLGMPWKDAIEARRASPDVGPVLVATDKAQIRWALDAPWLDYVIPYHGSMFPKQYAEQMGWTDFSYAQHEKWKPGRKPASPEDVPADLRHLVEWDENGPHITIRSQDYLDLEHGTTNAAAKKKYLDLTDRLGVDPVFPEFRDHPNYIRLKKDFARTDTPFRPVEARFDSARAAKVTEQYLRGELEARGTGKADYDIIDGLAPLFKEGLGTEELVHRMLEKDPSMKGKARTAVAAAPEAAAAEAPQMSRRPLTPAEAAVDKKIAWEPTNREGFLGAGWRIYQKLIRQHHSLEAFEKKIGDVRTEESASAAYEEALASGGRAQQFLAKGGFLPTEEGGVEFTGHVGLKQIFKDLKAGGEDARALSRYLIARRSLELEGRGIKSGVDQTAAREVVDNAPEPVKVAAERVTALLDDALEYWARSAGLPEAVRKVIRSLNQMYVPFYRMDREGHRLGDEATIAPETRRASLQPENAVKRITGGEKALLDPIVSTIDHINRMIRAGDLNKIGKRLTDLAASEPEAARGLVQRVESRDLAQGPKADAATALGRDVGVELTPEEAATVASLSDKDLSNNGTLRVYRDGKLETWKVDRDIADSLKALSPADIGVLWKVAAIPAQSLRYGTTRNPLFGENNIYRDTLDAYLQSTNGFRPFLDSAIGFYHAVRKTPLEQRYKAASGGFSGLGGERGLVGTAQVARHFTGDRTVWQTVKSVADLPREFLDRLSEPMEEATRLGEFRRALQRGKSDEAAALDAARITTNFMVHGSDPSMRTLSTVTAFLNPGLQGMDRMARVFKDKPAKAATYLFLRSLPMVAATAIIWAHNRDDEEINKARKSKAGSTWWYLRINPTTVLRRPKPFLWGQLFGTAVENALDAWADKDPAAVKRFVTSVWGVVEPTVTPNFLQIKQGVVDNKDSWTGAPIVPRGLSDASPRYQSTARTGETARAIGDALNVSPAKIEWGNRQIFGTLGSEALKVSDAAIRATSGKGISPPAAGRGEEPFVGRLFARTPATSTEDLERFWDDMDKIREAKRDVKAMVPNTDPERRREELTRLRPFIRASEAYEAVAKRISELRKAQDAVRRAPDSRYSPDEKRRKIDALTVEITKAASRIVDRRLLEEPSR